jgi:hypothetical protein
MNSSPVGRPSSSGGMRDTVFTEAKDWSVGKEEEVGKEDMMRERMVSLRATSNPFRSSAGCGSCVCVIVRIGEV